MTPAFQRWLRGMPSCLSVPTWSAHADWPNMSSDESSETPIPPWRNQSLWPITIAETVEGLSERRSGAKQQYEALLNEHAIGCAMLMNEFEEMKGMKTEEFEAKEQGWKTAIEDLFPLLQWREEQVITKWKRILDIEEMRNRIFNLNLKAAR